MKYKVTATLLDSVEDTKSDMTLRAEITYQRYDKQLTIPIQSIVYNSGLNEEKGIIFIVDNGVVTQQEVSLGEANYELQVISEGLKEGDVFVSGPYQTLKLLYDGAKVQQNG
ncbi:hypothetical protein [Glaciecola sp. MF2-115]|uniref:hypothetical protein n=1 Tax=Glaciecola sp. MF2-115 TaxID=3384827 RepID=UPI0039A131EB